MKFTKEDLELGKVALSFIESNLAFPKKFKLHEFSQEDNKYYWIYDACCDLWDCSIENLLICNLSDCSKEQFNFLMELFPQSEMCDEEDSVFNSTDPTKWCYYKPYFIEQLNTLIITSFVNFNAKNSGFNKLLDQEKIDLSNFFLRNKEIFDIHSKKIKIMDPDLKLYLQNLLILS